MNLISGRSREPFCNQFTHMIHRSISTTLQGPIDFMRKDPLANVVHMLRVLWSLDYEFFIIFLLIIVGGVKELQLKRLLSR